MVGALLFVYAFGIIASAPIFAILADRWKNKRLLMIGGLISLALAVALMGVADTYWMLVLARFLQGVSAGAIWSLGLALVADAYADMDTGMGQAMGTVLTGYTLGSIAGPPIGGFLWAVHPLAPFLCCEALIVIDLVARLLIVERKIPSSNVVPDQGEEEGVGERAPLLSGEGSATSSSVRYVGESVSTATSSNIPTNQDPTKVDWLHLLCSKQLLILLAICVLAGIVLTDIEPTLPLWLERIYGLNPFEIGMVFLALMVPNIVFGPLVGYLVDHYGSQPLMTIGVATTAVAQILPAFVWRTGEEGKPVLAWTCFALFLYSSALNFMLDPLAPEIANCVPRGAYSKAYSLFNMAWSFGIMIGPLIGSVIFDQFGWSRQIFFNSACLFLALPVAMAYRRPPPPSS